MSDPVNRLRETLRQHGQSLTAARLTVFRTLQDKEPQTMKQIVNNCQSIDRTSVYRTIRLFERLGIIRKLQIGWKYTIELSDSFNDHHHHLSCLRCGKIIPFEEGAELDHYLQKIARSQQFDMCEHQLEIQGYCKDCQPKYA